MKKFLVLFAVCVGLLISAQQTANRFFYELTYKPKAEVDSLVKHLMVLDVSENQSVYRDYLAVSQDSILKDAMEKMQRSGVFNMDFQSKKKDTQFSGKILKSYPTMKTTMVEMILSMGMPMYIGYEQSPDFQWKILPDTEKIGEYETQKAETEFGGRKWTAWFSSEIPFQDGPYKFSGLPGLIVKIEDDGGNYSWALQGNKKLTDYHEQTYMEQISNLKDPKILSRDKFEKNFSDFKKDPFGSMRQYLTADVMKQAIPGSTKTMGDFIKEGEERFHKIYFSITNPIELKAE